jgi:hypothetical protein
MRISTRSPTGTAPQLRCRSGVSGSAAARARRFIRAPRRHPAGSSQATRGWFETLRLYRDSPFAGAAGGEAGERKDDRRPTALRARPPRGAPRPRARGLRDGSVGRVVVAMRDSGDDLDIRSPHRAGPVWSSWGRDGNRQRVRRAMRQPWLAEILGTGQAALACWRYRRWLVLGPGCAAEDVAAPLAVKELRPLRGAFGVLDREPPARHRQNGTGRPGACLSPMPRSPRQRTSKPGNSDTPSCHRHATCDLGGSSQRW